MQYWTFTGQPTSEWPPHIIFLNFACDDEKVIIHTLWGRLTLNIGDTLVITPDRRMSVIKKAAE